MKFLLLTCFLAFQLFTETFSQTKQPDKIIQEIETEYKTLNYATAERKAKQALVNYQQFASGQLVKIHKYLGLIYFSQKRLDESEKQFKSALSINSDLTLSPLLVSPKIIDFFNTIKNKQKTKKKENVSVKYILLKDKRPGASWRSFMLPGWGQRYKGEKKKGTIIISCWATSMAGLLTTHLLQQKAQKNYLNSKGLNKIESNYNTYNKYYKTRNSIALLSLGLWLYAYIDAAVKKTPTTENFSISEQKKILLPDFSEDHIIFTYLFQL